MILQKSSLEDKRSIGYDTMRSINRKGFIGNMIYKHDCVQLRV